MGRMNKAAVIILTGMAVLVVLLSAGCVTSPLPNPVGDWQIQGTDISISLSSDGNFTGHAPVNTFFGTYTLYRGSISLDIQGTTQISASPQKMKEEDEFFQKFREITAFSTPTNKLQFYDNRGRTLFTFEKVEKTIIGSWKTSDGITLVFNSDGTFSGHSLVNQYGGNYLVNGNKIQLGSIFTTEMAGSDEDMLRENEYYKQLEQVSGFTLESGLTLTDKQGTVLIVFQKSTQ